MGSFTCDVCDSKFLQVSKLLMHIDSAKHVGLNCGICQTKTETEAEMLKHLNSCHRTPGRPFNCQFCDTKFRSNRELGLHILKHSDNNNHHFSCTICEKGFKWKQVLKMHMLTHSNFHAHKCPTCDFTTKYKSTLKTHMNRHLGRSFSCSECKFATAREQNLREHMKNHNSRSFMCPICQEKFTQKKNLTRHLVRHSTELPTLSCNECNFTTLRKDKLSAHMHMKHRQKKEEQSSKQEFDADPEVFPKQNKNSEAEETSFENDVVTIGMKKESFAPKCTEKHQNLAKESLNTLTNHTNKDQPEAKREKSDEEEGEYKADAVFQNSQKSESNRNKDCSRESNEKISITYDVQPLDMRIQETNATRDNLNVSITVTTKAEEDAESLPMCDSAIVEKNEPVFSRLLGLLHSCSHPPQFNSCPTGIPGSILKQEAISSLPNGDFVNPPNVTVTQSSLLPSAFALPFSFDMSPYLTPLSPSDVEAVLCEEPDDATKTKMTDEELILISTKDLNKVVKESGLTKEDASEIKKKRRTLKNRARANASASASVCKEESLKAELAGLESDVSELKRRCEDQKKQIEREDWIYNFRRSWALQQREINLGSGGGGGEGSESPSDSHR